MIKNLQGAGTENLKTGAAGVEEGAPAHKLCNLVQVVSGYLEMLAARTQDVLSLQYIATAHAAADQIRELAERLDQDARGTSHDPLEVL
jgi:hypothetical protein